MLLGAAKLLMKHKDLLRGKVKFMFQPGEEGGGGARTMVEAGVLRSPDVDACMAFHQVVARDHVPTGIIGYTADHDASADMFRITVRGKSAHGASPESGVNPVQDSVPDIQWPSVHRMLGKAQGKRAGPDHWTD